MLCCGRRVSPRFTCRWARNLNADQRFFLSAACATRRRTVYPHLRGRLHGQQARAACTSSPGARHLHSPRPPARWPRSELLLLSRRWTRDSFNSLLELLSHEVSVDYQQLPITHKAGSIVEQAPARGSAGSIVPWIANMFARLANTTRAPMLTILLTLFLVVEWFTTAGDIRKVTLPSPRSWICALPVQQSTSPPLPSSMTVPLPIRAIRN